MLKLQLDLVGVGLGSCVAAVVHAVKELWAQCFLVSCVLSCADVAGLFFLESETAICHFVSVA